MRVEIYRRADLLWAWRARASNGQIIATDGSQGYENRGDCLKIAKKIFNYPRFVKIDIVT